MISDNLNQVLTQISESCQHRTHSISKAVQLVAVTKNHDIHAMREAIDAGVTVIGENRVQEAQEKQATLDRNVNWHLIGHLQTNKAKLAVQLFDMIESVDSLKIATAINAEAAKINKLQPILVQVNLVKETSKSGIYPEALPELLHAIDKLTNLQLKGLMFIAPNLENKEEVRPMFAKMYDLFRAMQQLPLEHADWQYLSMGMTHDYTVAIEEGANLVRVGTGIFGQRQY